jgi:hypothetical protein
MLYLNISFDDPITGFISTLILFRMLIPLATVVPMMIVWMVKIHNKKLVMDRRFLLMAVFTIIFGIVYLLNRRGTIFETSEIQMSGGMTLAVGFFGMCFYTARWLNSIGRNPQ